jgi:hypothetical protein
MAEAPQVHNALSGRDVTKANPARMYDFMLGGKANFEVDRQAVAAIQAAMPDVDMAAWANRGFHQRAALWMAREGIRQFLDIGCGLPTVSNTHDVVQRVSRACRVVYVDHDPTVIEHARLLLAKIGNTGLTLADVRDPASLLTSLYVDGLIDLTRPVGLLCTAVMHFVADTDDPWWCVAKLVAALAPGSYMALSHVSGDLVQPRVLDAGAAAYQDAAEQVYPRSRSEVERFFDGLEMVPPAPDADAEVCGIGLWGAVDPATAEDPASRVWWAGVGRKGGRVRPGQYEQYNSQ